MNIFLPIIGIGSARFTENVSFLIWTSLIIFGILLSIFRDLILPVYFNYDSMYIAYLLGSEPVVGDSYSMTAYFYGLLGVHEQVGMIYRATIALFITIIMFFSIFESKTKVIGLIQFFCIVMVYTMSIVYLTTLSKDFVVFVFVALAFVSIIYFRRLGFFLYFLLALAYAYFFRKYWYLCVFSAIFLYFLMSMSVFKFKTISSIVFLFMVNIVVISLLYYFLTGENIDVFRLELNEGRMDKSVDAMNTAIFPFFDGGAFYLTPINLIVTWIGFFLPLTLLAIGGVYYIILSFYFFMLGYFSLLVTKSAVLFEDDRTVFFCVILFSFTIVQSCFEPDYGSFARHLSSLLPVIIYLISKYTYFKEKRYIDPSSR